MKNKTNNLKSEKINKVLLNQNWSLFKSEPDQYQSPTDFNPSEQQLLEATVPGTVAMAVNGKAPECWKPNYDYDDFDWWYIFNFSSLKNIDTLISVNKYRFYFEGLATLCEVWFNDKQLLVTNNMFRGYEFELTEKLKASDKLILVFRSVSHSLQEKRPRPRWKTKLVENQQMRWFRTTVLGHVPVWTPPIKAVGPWRNIYMLSASEIKTEYLSVIPSADNGTAKLTLSAKFRVSENSESWKSATILINEKSYPVDLDIQSDSINLSADLKLPELDLWWPHSHGNPITYSYKIELHNDTDCFILDSGEIGFKSTEFISNKKETAFYINGIKVFCRGTCWTVSDYLSLNAGEKELRELLTLMRDSGLNMVRVGGTMVYESDNFYKLCDQLGILVWQDFMFASMDYPVDDEDFSDNIHQEARYQLHRFNKHACISMYCGNTDVEGQAAMYGMPKEIWGNPFFDKFLPEACQSIHPDIPYLPSSPTGGALPFHLSEGVTHYWGVGAYMHPVADENKKRVKFASEGMGLSHIPEQQLIDCNFGKATLFPYSNDWTYRIPRDLGAGWDFDAIRDHYLEDIFKVDARSLRRQNVERFIALSRVVTGEALSQVFRYWRSMPSQCNGGLIWFNRDFWPCAGFGPIDSNNQPKAALYQLKQVWQPAQVILSNEGMDGAQVTVINETQNHLQGTIEIELIKNNKTTIASASQAISLDKHSQLQLGVDEILERFLDTGYAYRFGTPQFDVIICRLLNSDNESISESFLFPDSMTLEPISTAEISATAEEIDSDTITLTILSDHFLQYLKIDAKNYRASENYFHLSPSKRKTIILKKITESTRKFRGEIEAINLKSSVKIILQ